jgi:DNA-binding GntR family transcriptional regulator
VTAALDTRSLVDRVYEYLLTRIITGTIKYGDILSIKKIASELDISTMPVREAVKRLEFEQVVSIKPRSFCRVRTPSPKMIWEVYELRIFLEQYAVSKSLGHIPPKSRARLHAIVQRMRTVQAMPDTAARARQAIALDREFHVEICGLAQNDFLSAFYRQLSLLVNMSLIHEKTYQNLKRGWAGVHAEILRCIERKPAGALDALQRHFENVTQLLPASGSEGKTDTDRSGAAKPSKRHREAMARAPRRTAWV